MSHPKNHNAPDAWYKNVSRNAEGNFVDLDIGFCTFKPRQVRFLTGTESIRAGDPMVAALSNGRLRGPFATQAMAFDADDDLVARVAGVEVPTVEQIMARGYSQLAAVRINATQMAKADGLSVEEAQAAGASAAELFEQQNQTNTPVVDPPKNEEVPPPPAASEPVADAPVVETEAKVEEAAPAVEVAKAEEAAPAAEEMPVADAPVVTEEQPAGKSLFEDENEEVEPAKVEEKPAPKSEKNKSSSPKKK